MKELLRANAFVRFAVLYLLASFPLFLALGVLLHRQGAEIREQKGLLKHEAEISQKFEDLLGDLRETEAFRRDLFRIRPHPTQLISLVRELEGAASRAFIAQKISADREVVSASGTAGPASPVVRYRIVLEGPWEKFEAYLQELRRLRHVVRLENIRMAASPEGNLLLQGTISLSLVGAVLDPTAPVPTTEGGSDTPPLRTLLFSPERAEAASKTTSPSPRSP